MTNMPIVNMDEIRSVLTDAEFEIAAKAFTKRGGADRLMASCPKGRGPSAYVWRMICFIASPKSQHHCMPIGADFYIQDSDFAHRTDQYVPRIETDRDQEYINTWDQRTWNRMHKGEQRKNYIKEELDPIVDKVLDTIPKTQWKGAQRWSKAIYG